MAFHNNGRKFFHYVRCYQDKHHIIETDGMWFDIDEKKCRKHQHWATVIKANLTKHDAEEILKAEQYVSE